ncbi:MAG: EAL domain-containing protein [Agathobacter sp.]|nr:EAL domain-containing protein [Agathobacter sp.]
MENIQNIQNLASLDYLTGLVNRRGIYEYYASLDKESLIHAMFIDIDNFKRVNDIYGHSIGDKLLICISQLILDHTKSFAARMGGDEYVVLFDDSCSEECIIDISEKMLAGMQTLDFRKDILSLVSLSIGIVMNQSVSQQLDDILAKCDAAMYQAKYDGKNRYMIYKEFDKTIEISRNIELEMEGALKNGEFQVYFQPKVNMITTDLYGAEALSRWVHPVDGIRPPISYIPLFEKNGFISKLDMHIYEEVCRIKATWIGKAYEHIPVSVNMSRLHLYDRQFPDKLIAIAEKYNIPPKELEIEITESVFIKDSSEMILMVNRLRKQGFLVSIDDFGSGFSALNLLKDLPVDTIKLDREFLHVSSNTSRGKKVIRNVISMCRDLKMDVVTEGIETKEQIDFITSCGCPIAQGFYYAPPLPENEFVAFAEEYSKNPHLSHNFRLNGSLLSEDGLFEGSYCGEGFEYQQGIFRESQSLHFPGGSYEENTVHIPETTLVNDSFTLSMWIKPEVLHPWTCASYIKYETGFCAIIPQAWEGVSDCRIRDSRDINGWYDASGAPLQEGAWYHYVVTYNAKTETLVAFINGDVVAIVENVPTNRYAKLIMLGGDPYQPSFQGNLCELIIYNEPKDYDFVKELHQRYTSQENFIGF